MNNRNRYLQQTSSTDAHLHNTADQNIESAQVCYCLSYVHWQAT